MSKFWATGSSSDDEDEKEKELNSGSLIESNNEKEEKEEKEEGIKKSITIAQVGCTHGELDVIYNDIKQYEMDNYVNVDLLLCCGDFEACRNEFDLSCLSGPSKYHIFKDFYKYYNGECIAPILTIVIGGNHEACNHMRELYYGGWLAPNIYFLGYSGVIQFAGIRIGGFSGIFKKYDFNLGHYEVPPYKNISDKKSAFHVRAFELWKMKHIKEPIDIMMSHDWPNVAHLGDVDTLLRYKPWFRDDVMARTLGINQYNELIQKLQPTWWLSGHMHCTYEVEISHSTEKKTHFRALDKPIPHRKYLDYITIDAPISAPRRLHYDPEWLSIILATHSRFIKTKKGAIPPKKCLDDNVAHIKLEDELFSSPIPIPENFTMSVRPHRTCGPLEKDKDLPDPFETPFTLSEQTNTLLSMLGLDPTIIIPDQSRIVPPRIPAGRAKGRNSNRGAGRSKEGRGFTKVRNQRNKRNNKGRGRSDH